MLDVVNFFHHSLALADIHRPEFDVMGLCKFPEAGVAVRAKRCLWVNPLSQDLFDLLKRDAAATCDTEN